MNNRKSILAIGLIVTALFAAFVMMWMRRQGDQHSDVQASAGIIHDTESTSTHLPAFQSARSEKIRCSIEAANVPIHFWGKVIDESGVGVSGVHIGYLIQRAGRMDADDSIADDDSRESLVSSEDGLFSITNVRGTTLSMEDFTKVGYDVNINQQNTFSYFGTPKLFTPSQKEPHIFVMRSINQLLDVRKASQKIRMPWDGRAIHIDLDSCTVSPSGALVLTATRTELTGHFGWNLSLTIDGGDLKEAPTGVAFIAPVDGYVPKWQCGYEPNGKPWQFARDANVYYRQKGKFGRLKLQIYADAGPEDVSVFLETFVNMSGTRNTEGLP